MTTTREEEIDWQHVAKHGLAKVTPEHTWAEWLADRNAEIERLEAEITRLRSASQAGGVPAGWMDISTAPKDGTYVDIWGVNPAGRRFPGVRWTDWPPVGAVDGFTWRDERGVPVVDHADAVATNWMALPSAPGAPPPATDGALESEGLVQATVQGNGSVTLPVCQWQPIETAPKDGTWVLGFRPTSFREDQIDTWQFVHRSCDPPIWINSADSNDEDEQPTHWMPLPLPPDDRTNGSEAQSGSLNQALPASSVSATDAVEAERRLREALAPLAAFATFMDKDAPDEAYLPATVPHISLTLGQARAAATLLGFPHASDDPQFNGERLAAIRSRGTDEVENG